MHFHTWRGFPFWVFPLGRSRQRSRPWRQRGLEGTHGEGEAVVVGVVPDLAEAEVAPLNGNAAAVALCVLAEAEAVLTLKGLEAEGGAADLNLAVPTEDEEALCALVVAVPAGVSAAGGGTHIWTGEPATSLRPGTSMHLRVLPLGWMRTREGKLGSG